MDWLRWFALELLYLRNSQPLRWSFMRTQCTFCGCRIIPLDIVQLNTLEPNLIATFHGIFIWLSSVSVEGVFLVFFIILYSYCVFPFVDPWFTLWRRVCYGMVQHCQYIDLASQSPKETPSYKVFLKVCVRTLNVNKKRICLDFWVCPVLMYVLCRIWSCHIF